MNVPAIRAALERMKVDAPAYAPEDRMYDAVVRVGLRACDEADGSLQHRQRDLNLSASSALAIRRGALSRLEFLADILREAGVEVEG